MGSAASTRLDGNQPRVGHALRAALILTTLTIAMMPVTYRGGAEAAHPHAFFQFWLSGDGAAHRHHADHADHGHHAQGANGPDASSHREGHASNAGGGSSSLSEFLSAGQQDPADSENDLAKVSKMTGPGGAGSAMPLLAQRPLVAAEPAQAPWRPRWVIASPVDRATAPEPPPPRRLVPDH